MAKTGNGISTGESSEGNKIKAKKKEKKTKVDNTLKSITCIACKQVFTEIDAKIVCYDRCETGNVTSAPTSLMQVIAFY